MAANANRAKKRPVKAAMPPTGKPVKVTLYIRPDRVAKLDAECLGSGRRRSEVIGVFLDTLDEFVLYRNRKGEPEGQGEAGEGGWSPAGSAEARLRPRPPNS